MAAKTTKQQEETTPAATTGNDAVNNPEAEGEGQQTTDPEEIVSVLIAQTYILYNSKHYKPGDVLPANDPDMLLAWIDAGTAAWVDAK